MEIITRFKDFIVRKDFNDELCERRTENCWYICIFVCIATHQATEFQLSNDQKSVPRNTIWLCSASNRHWIWAVWEFNAKRNIRYITKNAANAININTCSSSLIHTHDTYIPACTLHRFQMVCPLSILWIYDDSTVEYSNVLTEFNSMHTQMTLAWPKNEPKTWTWIGCLTEICFEIHFRPD